MKTYTLIRDAVKLGDSFKAVDRQILEDKMARYLFRLRRMKKRYVFPIKMETTNRPISVI